MVRILGILKVLMDGARPSVHELAARFKTRRETIYRDLRVLEEVGYPIRGDESGRIGGRPRLATSGLSGGRPTPFTRQEVAALVWAIKRSEARQPFHAALATALPKLQALITSREARTAIALDGALGGWERGVKDYRGHQATILRLVEAIVSRRRCRVVDYRSPLRDRPTTFLYDPYKLLAIQGGLYAIGKTPGRGPAPVAVDRIGKLEVLDDSFDVDRTVDLKRYETETFGVWWGKPMTVVVRFSARQAPFVREREWHPTQKLRELRDGRLELTFRAAGVFEITRWILGWGDAAEVIRPATVRRWVSTAHTKATAIYGPPHPGKVPRDRNKTDGNR